MATDLDSEFEHFVEEAVNASFSGWDFSWLGGRRVLEDQINLKEIYDQRAHSLLKFSQGFFDHGTGGGEHLGQLGPFPALSVATEAYSPNVVVAALNLRSAGIQVVQFQEDCHDIRGPQADGSFAKRRLPFRDTSFDLVLAYNSAFCPAEICRVLQPGGTLLTCQVGSAISPNLAEVLEGSIPTWEQAGNEWNIGASLKEAGFEIVQKIETVQKMTFRDIGAVIYYLQAVPWAITDFEVEKYKERLLKFHYQIKEQNGFIARNRRWLFEVRKPERS